MPTSNLAIAPTVIYLIWELKPKKVLDVGPGWGKYGLLLREYVHPDLVVDCIELWEPYVTHRLRALYDTVHVGDVCDMTAEALNAYDVVLMSEVIEHIDKERALELLDRITVPVVLTTPEKFFENPPELPPTERHVSHWKQSDFGDRIDQDHSMQGGVILRLAKTA